MAETFAGEVRGGVVVFEGSPCKVAVDGCSLSYRICCGGSGRVS